MKRAVAIVLLVAGLVFVPAVAAEEEEPPTEATPVEVVDEAPVEEEEEVEALAEEVEVAAEEGEEPGDEYEVPDSPISEETMADIVEGVFGTGGLLFAASQIFKLAIVVLRHWFPQFQPKAGFMGIANLILGALLFGGISIAALKGLEVTGIIDFLKQISGLVLELVQMIAGSTLYYMFFKNMKVPLLGYSLSPEAVEKASAS